MVYGFRNTYINNYKPGNGNKDHHERLNSAYQLLPFMSSVFSDGRKELFYKIINSFFPKAFATMICKTLK